MGYSDDMINNLKMGVPADQAMNSNDLSKIVGIHDKRHAENLYNSNNLV